MTAFAQGSDSGPVQRRSRIALSLSRVDRALFAATVCMMAAILWLTPRLPLIDLPQHAAQVALWRDLLLGNSPWAGLVHINLLTPYLIGYGLMLPLSFVMPVEAAARLVLVAALVGQIGACILLRRALGGDRRLDWLFVFGSFGFAWQWGFLTFLVAAPLGLVFLWAALRHAREPRLDTAVVAIALGLALLLSHGLVFLAFVAIGGLLVLSKARSWFRANPLVALLPYATLGGACLLFRLLSAQQEGAFHHDEVIYGIETWYRPIAAFVFQAGMELDGQQGVLACVAAALFIPIVLGSAFNGRESALIAAGLALVFLALPTYAFQTGFLFERFALFVMPFYAFQFRAVPSISARRDAAGLAFAVGASWLLLGMEAMRLVAFAQESRPFETVLAAAEPGHRALGLIFDRDSPSAHNSFAYMHYASWYQADKHGFVDFNFAFFPPQVVRFRPAMTPPVRSMSARSSAIFDWNRTGADAYTYFFVRGDADDVATVERKSRCGLDTVAADGSWTLLKRRSCGLVSQP